MLIYNTAADHLSELSNDECGELIKMIVDEFKKCLYSIRKTREFMQQIPGKPIEVKKMSEPVYHVIHQDLQLPPVRSAFYRRQGVESRKGRRGFHKYYYLEPLN